VTADEIERIIRANIDKTVLIVDVDGITQSLFVHSVDEEGFVCDLLTEMSEPPLARTGYDSAMFVRLFRPIISTKSQPQSSARTTPLQMTNAMPHALAGSPDAQCTIALLYEAGWGVQRDFLEAERC
jgi:hypothetical protein